MFLRRLYHDETGSPSTEFVLALPIMLALIFGAMEAGNFFWSQQKLVQSVRNGSRYAARQPYNELCPSNGSGGYNDVADATATRIKNVTRTGNASGSGPSELPGWGDAGVTVTAHCDVFLDSGIYGNLDAKTDGSKVKGAIVTVAAPRVRYISILGGLGFINDSFNLAAQENAPVIGV